jgi:hypothetical protein
MTTSSGRSLTHQQFLKANFESFDSRLAFDTQITATGIPRATAIWLPAGLVVTSVSFYATIALVAGTGIHSWGAIYTPGLVLGRQSTDDTAPTWAIGIKTFTLSSTYTTVTTGFHYIVENISQTGGTLPTLAGYTGDININILATKSAGTGASNVTATATDPIVVTGTAFTPWGYVS